MNRALLAVIATGLLAAGCAPRDYVYVWPYDSPVLPPLEKEIEPEPGPKLIKQYVVLLPDDDGVVGEIDVTDGEQTVTLTKAYEAVDFDNLGEPYAIDPPASEATFGRAVDHLPRRPMTFTVYFDYASARPTAASESVLAEVLGELGRRSAPSVEIDGHADRAGAASANRRMSKRRAEAVRDRLFEAGVPTERIAEIEWHGEDRPAIPTEDGVVEPGNRRVEIIVR